MSLTDAAAYAFVSQTTSRSPYHFRMIVSTFASMSSCESAEIENESG